MKSHSHDAVVKVDMIFRRKDPAVVFLEEGVLAGSLLLKMHEALAH